MPLMRRLLLTPLALLALAATAPAADAIDRAGLQQALGREMARVGSASGAFVRDLETGETLYARRATTPRIPASVEKLLVTSVALRELGPDSRLRTTVLGAGALDADGVWRGDLVLRGAGDPTLSTASLTALARLVAEQTGIRRVDGAVLGDESAFDRLRGSSRTLGAYDRDMGGVLSALAVGRGFSRDGRPALEAARRFAKALRAAGVRVDGRSAEGVAPEGATELAAHDSPPRSTRRRTTSPRSWSSRRSACASARVARPSRARTSSSASSPSSACAPPSRTARGSRAPTGSRPPRSSTCSARCASTRWPAPPSRRRCPSPGARGRCGCGCAAPPQRAAAGRRPGRSAP